MPKVQSAGECKAIGELCSGISDCCPTYVTELGTFYGYCQGTCRPVDGINNNYNELEWCKQYIYTQSGSKLPGFDYYANYQTVYDPAISSARTYNFLWDHNKVLQYMSMVNHPCDLLFFGHQTSPQVMNSGFIANYDEKSNLVRMFEGYSLIQHTLYNTRGYGGVYAAESPISGLSTSSVDPAGNMHKSTDSLGNEVAYFYDDLDRLVKKIDYRYDGHISETEFYYDSYSPLTGGESCSTTDNSFDLLCEVRDESGYEKYLYDVRERLIWMEKTIYDENLGPHRYTMEFGYDEGDNIILITMPDGRDVKFEYSSINQIKKVYYETTEFIHDGGFEEGLKYWGDEFPYFDIPEAELIIDDPAQCYEGNKCIKAVKGNWWVIQWLKLQPNTEYVISYYTKDGQSLENDGPRVAICSDDDIGWCGQQYVSCSVISTDTWQYHECVFESPSTTDNNPNIHIMIGSDGIDKERYVLVDSLSLQQTEHQNEEMKLLANLDYTASGKVKEVILNPDAESSEDIIYSTYDYDHKNQLRAMYHSFESPKNENNIIFKRGMSYDPVGNIDHISYDVDINDPENLLSTDESYVYDNLYRLTNADFDGTTFEYTYKNLLGDRDTLITNEPDMDSLTYHYNGYQVSSVDRDADTITYGYDDYGNVISSFHPEFGLFGFSYDTLNRLIESERSGIVTTFAYDYNDARVKKTGPAGTTFYLYKGEVTLAEDIIPEGYCPYNCGNINTDKNNAVDINDVNTLMNMIYGILPASAMCAANVDGSPDNTVNVYDLLVLMEYVIDGNGALACTGKGYLDDNPDAGWTIEQVQDYISGS